MWVAFVVGSILCSERFFSSRYSGFPSPRKPTFLNFISTRNQVDEEPLCGFAASKSLFVYLFIYLLTPRYDNCWQKHSNCISLYYFVDHVHNVSKIQSNPRGSERAPTKPVTFRTKKSSYSFKHFGHKLLHFGLLLHFTSKVVTSFACDLRAALRVFSLLPNISTLFYWWNSMIFQSRRIKIKVNAF